MKAIKPLPPLPQLPRRNGSWTPGGAQLFDFCTKQDAEVFQHCCWEINSNMQGFCLFQSLQCFGLFWVAYVSTTVDVTGLAFECGGSPSERSET